ncbi:hypothetical protein A6302_04341 [Methylobrevis pamukkalensis]|uniref:Uncharacterized protein n=1 Tax=Methylobrevis pamukkalensis TaxID=1439726 RepID=A0A1E3GWT0_9HYPH|nr:hypothetical protein A6302_04341 [Methylobrevis pamukkalensis]
MDPPAGVSCGHVRFDAPRHRAPCLVRPPRPPPALAPAAGGDDARPAARSLPRLAVGDHAAADDGGDGDRLFHGLHHALADTRRPCGCRPRGRDEALGRARLLFAGAQSQGLRRGAGARPQRRLSRHGRGPAHPSRHRPLHGGGDRGDRLRPAGGRDRRQRRARRQPAAPGRGAAAVVPAGVAPSHRGDDAEPAAGRLCPGDDGSRRDDLHPAPAGLRALSARRRVRCAGGGRCGHLPPQGRQGGPAGAPGHGLPRATGGWRHPAAPPPRPRPARRHERDSRHAVDGRCAGGLRLRPLSGQQLGGGRRPRRAHLHPLPPAALRVADDGGRR